MLAAAGGLGLLAIALVVARVFDFPAFNRRVPPTVLHLGLRVEHCRVFCIARFIDSQWLWQARLPESELERLIQRFDLRRVDQAQVPDEFRSMSPYWWQPAITEQTTVLMTPGFPLSERGPDGWFAVATWNSDDEMLHMWIKDNF